MEMDHDARENTILNTTVQDTVSKILESVDDPEIGLKVNRVWVDDGRDNKNIDDQKQVRMKGQIWGNDLRADLELVDKITGKTIDHVKNIKVANIPKITDRGTFLVKGNEYQFTKQSRLKPGVYTKRQSNGQISSFFNVDKTVDFERGFNNNFKIHFDPDDKTFKMQYGSKNIPLYNSLRSIGMSIEKMKSAWGPDVFEANKAAFEKHQFRDQNKLYLAIFGKSPGKDKTDSEIKEEIKKRLFDTELDPDTTKITLGKPYQNVGEDPLIDASKKIIDIHKGEAESDDRESLIFKSFYDIDDHIKEKLIKNSDRIIGNIKFKLKKNRSINKAISSQSFDPWIIGTVTNSQLSSPPNQTNPMSILGESTKVTVMGEGGIGTANAVTNETRNISNSEVGFMDPLHTPEGGNIGVAVHTSMDTIRIGKDLFSKFLKKDGEKVILRPIDVYDKNVSFPDQFEIKNGKPVPRAKIIKAINKGKFVDVPASKVDAIIASPRGMFDTSSNMIPFLNSIQGNRGLTAAKMYEQALSLEKREKPMFAIVDDNGKPIAENLGKLIGVPKSPVDGKVVKIEKNEIVVQGKDGKENSIKLYDNFSLNSESFLSNDPIVAVGDSVKKGDALADNNFTKDGQMALGANLRVAYVPWRGYNFEDSAIMSESAAKKLTSQHMYDLKTKRSSKGVFSRNKFREYYPEELMAKNMSKLDKDGVVKPGEILERGDVAIAHLEKRMPTADDLALGRLDKQLRRDMADHAVRWENDHQGEVTSVEKHGNSVVVNVKTREPLKVADKVSGLHGNKHIISKIIPDEEMPIIKETGQRIDMTMNPIGVSNRINTSQLLENAAGKIAEKTGEQYKIRNFSDQDNTRKVLEDLKNNGLSDKDILIDPETGSELLNPVATGVSHILKLEHKVDHKFSSRYRDGYDSNEQAVTGGEAGGKNLGRMEIAALLARGANENLREAFQIKGQRNDEFWKAMETGQSLPPPKKSFVWDKMLAMMAGSGINVEQKGKTFSLKPMTDEDILEKSKGKIEKPYDTYRKKDLAPMKEGLFDPVKAGGMQGDYYTHFELPEKVLNPITASAAATLLDIPLTHLDRVLEGKKFIDKTTGELVKPGTPNSISGSPAAELLLGRIKVDEDLKQANALASSITNPAKLNALNKKIKILKSLQENDMKPTDYFNKNVLVIPSKYRPMFSMGTEGTVIMSDINDIYQQAAYSADALKSLKSDLKENIKDDDITNLQLAESRGQLYKDMKAIAGLQDPTSYKTKDKKGFVAQIDGGKKQTKEGFFQAKVLERRQDLVGRSTIILNPGLGGDEIGIPEEMANDIFRPFIMKKMVSWGYSPLEAQKQIKDETSIYKRALQVVADERLVIANRAPTLHRWNMTAFKPKLTQGKSIEVPGIVIGENFSGDYDGDTFQIHTPISQKAIEEAKKMVPSASMLKTGFDSVLNAPSMDMLVGSWLVSKGMGGEDTKLKLDNIEQARELFKNNKISYGDTITIDGKKSTFGIHEINSVVPESSQKWDIELNKKSVESWIRDVTKEHNGKIALGLADKIKDVGNNYVTKFGYTLGISDTVSDNEIRDKAIAKAEKSVGKFTSPDKIVSAYTKARDEAEKELEEKHKGKTMLGIGMSSGGSKGVSNTTAITIMPGIVTDADDVPIPMPITKSYSEGLGTFDYWAAAHGARGGNIKKSVSSYKPGWLSKDLINSIYETRIGDDAPVDMEGLEYSIDDSKGIMNRYLAKDVANDKGHIIAKRNEIITSDTKNKLVKNKIKTVFVQSPITDPTPTDSFSSYSYGVDYEGKRHNVGDNIGIMSAQTITEPSLKMAMKAFHTGGTLKGEGRTFGTVFDRLDRTLRFTKNLPDKAILASMDGVVKSIDKSSIGGYDVVLSDGEKEEERYVDPNNELLVKPKQKVSSGDKLSTGTPSTHDMLKYKGMRETQKFLIDELDKINEGKLDKRDIETVVRGITNTTRVMHSGNHPHLVPGDVTQLSSVENFNKNNRKEEDVLNTFGDHLARDYDKYKMHTKINEDIIRDLAKKHQKIEVFKDRVKHEPFLTPTGIQAKAQSSEDWISRLAHNRIKKVLEEGTTQGWKTVIDPLSGNPLPRYITGEY